MAALVSPSSLVRERRVAKAPKRARPARSSAAPARGWQGQLRQSVRSVERARARARADARGARRRTPRGARGAADRDHAVLPVALRSARRVVSRCACSACRGSTRPTRSPGDLVDPLGEVDHEVAPHLVRRYPDRVLLLATDRCAVYCRFCTRSRIVGDGGGPVSLERLEPAFAWIAAHPEIRDVIVSGGDPLAMATERLDRLLGRIRAIPTVETIRLATRVPVTLPMRITAELVRALRKHHPIWVMTHFNHPKELTRESIAACTRLADGGFPVMNQTVLLAGVNDDAGRPRDALPRPRPRARAPVLPAPDRSGPRHGPPPHAARQGRRDPRALAGPAHGHRAPEARFAIPRAARARSRCSPDYVVGRGEGRTTLRTFRGEEVTYVDPPARPSRAR